MTPKKKKTSSTRTESVTEQQPPRAHAPLVQGEPLAGVERGERETTREDDLIGTSSTHTPARDVRPEEPTGELSPNADTEGGID